MIHGVTSVSISGASGKFMQLLPPAQYRAAFVPDDAACGPK